MVFEPEAIRQLIEAAVAGASLLAGTIAFISGTGAAQALDEGRSSADLAQSINEGVAKGFRLGQWIALAAVYVVLFS
jgi:hypothetical protein